MCVCVREMNSASSRRDSDRATAVVSVFMLFPGKHVHDMYLVGTTCTGHTVLPP